VSELSSSGRVCVSRVSNSVSEYESVSIRERE
jgi:hypothetical protein